METEFFYSLFKRFLVAVYGVKIGDKLTADVTKRDKRLIVNPVDKVHRWCILVCTMYISSRFFEKIEMALTGLSGALGKMTYGKKNLKTRDTGSLSGEQRESKEV